MKLTDNPDQVHQNRQHNVRLVDGGGLCLLLTPAGGRLWRWKDRFGGKEKLMTLGKYHQASLLAAREKHSAARKLLSDGVDPMAQRKAHKVAADGSDRHAFQKIAVQWHTHWAVGKSSRVAVIPVLGSDFVTSPQLCG